MAASKGRDESKEGIQTRGRMQLRGWFDGTRDGETRTHAKLADLLGVTKPAIGYWLKGTSRPEPHLRAAIEAITGIPAADWEKDEERQQYQATLVKLASERDRSDTDRDGPPTEDSNEPPSSDANPKIGASARERTGSNG